MTSQYWSTVIKDFEKALEDSDDYNVIIKAGEESDVKELRAHSFVLRARCPYFKRALSNDWEDKDDDGNFILKKPNISFEVFQLILRYLYTGNVDYSQYKKEVILQFLIAADELGLNELIEYIQEYFIESGEYLKDPVSTLQVIYQHEPFERLKNNCLEIISDEPKVLFSSQKFPSLEKPIITMVLERDDLNMEEIEIWESLHRWISVHYILSDDDSTWSSEDMANIKQTIQEYIPLIRFYDISREDFYLKVYPYKDLLPQDLLNDILRYHMVPNSTPMLNFKPSRGRKVNSVLINYNFFMLFAKWIDRQSNDYTKNDMPYRFTLLLRGTKDGFDASKFHQLCDNKGATLVVARIKASDQIVGGYNPLSWNQNGSYTNTSESYLFYVTNRKSINNAKLGRVSNNGNAIYNNSSSGPTFGNGNDLYASGTSWSSNNGSYTNINIPNSFTIDEYEVFKVTKKGT